jgi:hypothetical protein
VQESACRSYLMLTMMQQQTLQERHSAP